MELRSTMDYAVHVTTRYIQLHSTGEDSTWDYAAPETIYNYAVQETTRYMGLRSTRDYAVHGTTQYRRLHGTGEEGTRDYAAPGTTHYNIYIGPKLGLATQARTTNDATLKLVLKVILYLVLLIQAEQ